MNPLRLRLPAPPTTRCLAGDRSSARPRPASAGARRRVRHARRPPATWPRSGKRVLVIFLSGGVSQLETWDPKPGTDTGGPFQAIPTSVPGIHICELLPHTAKQMHRLALVRGINTAEDDHGRGATIMLTGRQAGAGHRVPAPRRRRGQAARHRRRQRCPATSRSCPAAAAASASRTPPSSARSYASVAARRRQAARRPAPPRRPDRPRPTASATRCGKKLNDRFAKSRRTAATDAYTESYDQAAQVIARRATSSTSTKEDPKLADRYGRHDFGRHLLLARRLLEAGVTFVKVTHSNYDTHHENFDFHIEQLGEFDRPFATLLDDLADRGMLESTLVVVMSRVRPHAADQPPLRPRPLVEGVVGRAGRLRHQGRGGRRQDERQRHRRHRPRGERRAPVPHLPAGRRPRPDEELLPERPADPDRRPEGERDHGGAGVDDRLVGWAEALRGPPSPTRWASKTRPTLQD